MHAPLIGCHGVRIAAGHGEYLLEELEPELHFECLLQLMPTVADMAARLKPKMIQDPLLDAQGRPYTYAGLSRWVCVRCVFSGLPLIWPPVKVS